MRRLLLPVSTLAAVLSVPAHAADTSSVAVSPDAGVAEAAPPPPPPPPPPPLKRVKKDDAKAPPADAGVRDAGTAPAAFVGPLPPPVAVPPPNVLVMVPEEQSTLDRTIERARSGARAFFREIWGLVQLLLATFLVLRLLSWVVRRAARDGNRLGVMLSDLWVFIEAAGWLFVLAWIARDAALLNTTMAAILAGMVLLVLVLLSWGPLKDIAAGLMISAERPFSVGDHVTVGDRLTVGDKSGRVMAFRTRVLELETDDGHRIRIPYRDVRAADIRAGGRRTAHAVQLTLDLPEGVEPGDALAAARELAASSPWSVLGISASLSLETKDDRPAIRMEAYAFDREAGPLLHADLLSGWQKVLRQHAT